MSETSSIKIQIAGRSYPLKVEADQQESVLAAVTLIEQQMKAYENAYGKRDQQDLLAMCALQLATEKSDMSIAAARQQELLNKELDQITGMLQQKLTPGSTVL